MTLVEIRKSKNPELEKELVAKHNKLRLDYLWIFANSEMLRNKYPNKYVAVRDGEVVFVNNDAKRLLEKIAMTDEDINDFAIEYVRKKPTCFLL